MQYLDYDLDGDLDMYLLNHAVHSELSFGNANIRNKRSYECGDKLFRNDNGKFVDVSEKAGIFWRSQWAYLGIAVSDFNLMAILDIYIARTHGPKRKFHIAVFNGNTNVDP